MEATSTPPKGGGGDDCSRSAGWSDTASDYLPVTFLILFFPIQNTSTFPPFLQVGKCLSG